MRCRLPRDFINIAQSEKILTHLKRCPQKEEREEEVQYLKGVADEVDSSIR